MSPLGLAPFNVHELVKLQHPPLAATPPLASLVEDGHPGVVHAALAFPVPALEFLPAALPPTRHARLDLETCIVVFGLFGRRRRTCARRRSL